MKRWVGLFALLLLLSSLSAGFWGWRKWAGPGPAAADSSVLLEIPPGMTLTAAADTLVQRRLLHNATILRLGARLTGQGRGLRAGLYQLDGSQSARDLLANLTSGSTVQVKVTLPEGLDAAGMARIMADALEFSADRFLVVADSLVRSKAESDKLLPPGQSVTRLDSLLTVSGRAVPRTFHWCEGYLAPDTYLFSVGTGVLTSASHLFTTQLARLDSALVCAGGKSTVFDGAHELLTLASIVEAEARLPEERPLIAAVYSNRLRRNWRLEADPTVAYILHKKGKRMFFRDLEVDSPYNAYRRGGLPPGPIGNPGLASILAAAEPDSSCQAMYFVSDGQGGHVFSRTLREHQEAVGRFRRSKAAERSGRN